MKNRPDRRWNRGKNLLLNCLLIAPIFSLFFMLPAQKSAGYDSRIVTAGNEFFLQKAATEQAREKGLSGRVSMKDDQGMLFVFGAAARQCIWMKDMNFSLDIIWLTQRGKIIRVLNNVGPDTFPEIFCADNTKYVIELNDGAASRAGLRVGDSVEL